MAKHAQEVEKGRGLTWQRRAYPHYGGAVVPPTPEKIAEAVVKVLETRYDAYKKFGAEWKS